VGDPVLDALLAEAADDPGTLGLLLTGSRSAGLEDERSDYDIIWLLTDAAHDERKPAEAVLRFPGHPPAEIFYTCPRDFAAAEPGWWTYGNASGRVLLDKTGALAEALARIGTMPEDLARAEAYDAYDGYLNAFVRSTRAHERGDELGARIHAAESVAFLARALYALERRWTPYHDRLRPRLPELAGQGWAAGELEDAFLAIVRTADPAEQRRLQARVEPLMESRGVLAHREWGHALAHAKQGS
jgi:hypothetical protein